MAIEADLLHPKDDITAAETFASNPNLIPKICPYEIFGEFTHDLVKWSYYTATVRAWSLLTWN